MRISHIASYNVNYTNKKTINKNFNTTNKQVKTLNTTFLGFKKTVESVAPVYPVRNEPYESHYLLDNNKRILVGTHEKITISDGGLGQIPRGSDHDFRNIRNVFPVGNISMEFGQNKNEKLIHEPTNPGDSRITHQTWYFADPEEVITEEIRNNSSIILHDNRVAYPTLSDVQKTYLDEMTDAKDLGSIYKNISEYYYRLEMADRRTLDNLRSEKSTVEANYEKSKSYKEELDEKINSYPWQNKQLEKDKEVSDYYYSLNESKLQDIKNQIPYYTERIKHSALQQKKAIEAYNIFQEVGLKLYARDDIRHQIQDITHDLDWAKKCLEYNNEDYSKYNAKKTELEEINAVLKETKEAYNKLAKKQQNNDYRSKISQVESDYNKIAKEISEYEQKLEKTNKNRENYIREINKLQARIDEKSVKWKELCEDIKSQYYKIENFYNENVEDWQTHVEVQGSTNLFWHTQR